jgi:hypothetical protein
MCLLKKYFIAGYHYFICSKIDVVEEILHYIRLKLRIIAKTSFDLGQILLLNQKFSYKQAITLSALSIIDRTNKPVTEPRPFGLGLTRRTI